ncbi:MAG: hypothetical protein R3B97_00340 [Dehalococcoidia bacterium]|nr:hypothetical protein [Dehalococcoidia bacterium]MCB9485332.1 hypothetical protein [Thermoflexaceae bacterium]
MAANAESQPRVIWARSVDRHKQRLRWKRFGLWYCAPVLLLLVPMAVFAGPWEALGAFILLGGFGLLVACWIFFKNLGQRVNPEVRSDGITLFWARRRVPLAEVQRYSTFMSSVEGAPAFVGGDSAAQIRHSVEIGVVRFALPDGKEVEFKWPELPEAELDTLRAALDSLLPGRWRQVKGWYDPQS